MEHTQGGFLISKIKQIQGRILKTVDRIWNSMEPRAYPLCALGKRFYSHSRTIQRIYDPSDRRSIKIKLTDNARGLKEKYDNAEIILFEANLEQILNNLEKKLNS